MTLLELQRKLTSLGYPLTLDGKYGPKTRAAIKAALTAGTDDKLTTKDVQDAADALGVNAAKIWTVWDVEAAASPFIDGRPTILYEPHIFGRLTKGKYNASHPNISSAKWNRKLYPGSQEGRYEQLLTAIGIDVDAGLSSASYGGFQILGSNFKVCGYDSPWEFVYSQSLNERMQLLAFVQFVLNNGLAPALRKGDWAAFARGYNGSAYRENKYDEKLAKAYAKRSK